MAFVEVRTERLTLKPLGTEFLASTAKYAMEPENTKYMCFYPKTLDEVKAFLAGVDRQWQRDVPDFYEFAVICKDAHIGAVSLYLEDGIGELGWIIQKDHWNCGYAFEAAAALIQFASSTRNVKHFRAHCDAENFASCRVMEKLGMQKVSKSFGRKNRGSDRIGYEYQYEWIVE